MEATKPSTSYFRAGSPFLLRGGNRSANQLGSCTVRPWRWTDFRDRQQPTQMSHLRCEVRVYPIAGHPKIIPFILYVWTLSEPLNNLYLLGKLTERQWRKVTDLRETMAAGLRHGCSSVCINCLPLRYLKIWKGERYVQPHSWFLFYPRGHAHVLLGLYSLDWPLWHIQHIPRKVLLRFCRI